MRNNKIAAFLRENTALGVCRQKQNVSPKLFSTPGGEGLVFRPSLCPHRKVVQTTRPR